MRGIVGHLLRSIGGAAAEGGEAPGEPALAVVNDGTGTSVTATVAGDDDVTNQLYYREQGQATWTKGASRVDDGTIPQTGLLANTWYSFIVISELAGESSVPSICRHCYVTATDDSVVEQIAENLQATINAITLANGWHQDLVAVRPTRIGFEADAAPEDGKVVIIQQDPEADEELSAEGNVAMQAWLQPFALVAFVIASDADTTAIDTRLNQVRADIEQKLQQDPGRSGLAIDTVPMGSIHFSEGPGVTGIVVVVGVRYRTRRNDPYQNA